eukprot:13489581-Heterocapsa_arctica.AAC.1
MKPKPQVSQLFSCAFTSHYFPSCCSGGQPPLPLPSAPSRQGAVSMFVLVFSHLRADLSQTAT